MKTYDKGIWAHRLEDKEYNKHEIAFAKKWQKENGQKLRTPILYYLLDGNVSDRDIEVSSTIIQWLGSEVGISFLRGVIDESPEIKEQLNLS